MKSKKYIIPEISAQSIISAAIPKDGGYSFYLDASDITKEHLIENTQQDDCPIFYQAMLIIGENPDKAEWVSDKLKDIFVYIDFSGVFDRKPVGRVSEHQKIAEYMFRPEGIILNFGKEDARYIAFERSASMSRENRLSFIRADVYEPLRERMMLGLHIGLCQLSKLHAYNALLFTSGARYNDDTIFSDKRISVIKNPKSIIKNVPVVTVCSDDSAGALRKYTRVEKVTDIRITEFDGEGFVSPRLADRLDAEHNSFQIRMPYIKGVVHRVDFAALLSELDVSYIVDMWGEKHSPAEVDIILTESMFKGLGWMTENGLSWAEYLERCNKYRHALYISGKDKTEPQNTTELNYQFLNTLSMTDDEFRPKDLPLGWKSSPEYDRRHWITKTTETEYYRLVADHEARRKYFTDELGEKESLSNRRRQRAELLTKNALFIDEPIYAGELKDRAETLLAKYAVGKLSVAGDNRYLSDDLLRLIAGMVRDAVGEGASYRRLEREFIEDHFIYAPQPNYETGEYYTVLRSPHIARNEEVLVKPMAASELREKYFSHLNYVIMVDSRSLIPERLGGADFDGDMVKTIADPLINRCVMRSSTELPLLKIPAEQPLIADASDWYERFVMVRNTLSSRVGQISNAALDRGIVAYDENTADEDKERCFHEVETLAILTGLEIDSAKSGVKPDLSEYTEKKTARRSIFLRYKAIAGNDDEHRWYEPSKNARLKKFFESIAWSDVSSNLERLPYLAYRLRCDTEAVTVTPVSENQMFLFAQAPNWKEHIDPAMLARVAELIADYETALNRVRYVRHISTDMKRKGDIYRILFARGQEKEYAVDELYSAFEGMLPQRIRKARLALSETEWHLVPPKERLNALGTLAGGMRVYAYADVFCDFRCGGYRIVGDIICDLDDMYRKIGIQKNFSKQKGDSRTLQTLLSGVTAASDYKEQIIRNCLSIIRPIDGKNCLDYAEVIKCAVALGKRQFILEVLPFAVSEQTIDRSHIYDCNKPQKKRRLWR